MGPSTNTKTPRPPHRRLPASAFDPILSTRIDTREVNEVTIRLSWVEDLGPGPADDYLEAVDREMIRRSRPSDKAFEIPEAAATQPSVPGDWT